MPEGLGRVENPIRFFKSTVKPGIVGFLLGGLSGAVFAAWRHTVIMDTPSMHADLDSVSRFLFFDNFERGMLILGLVGAVFGWVILGLVWRRFKSS